MKVQFKRLVSVLSLAFIFFSFQTVSVFAKDLTVISVDQENLQSEYKISQDSLINSEDGVVIPKLIIESGVEIVEINADIQVLEVATHNDIELNGIGNITDVIISTDKKVSINTTGNIQKIEVTNKEAKLLVKEGTKIATLKLPEGSKAEDIIKNFEQAKNRFENISGGIVTPEPVFVEEDIAVPGPAPVEEETPAIPEEDEENESDFDFEGEKGNSTLEVALLEGEITQIGIIPSNVSNIYVELFADEDVDLEIWDIDNDIPVLAYGNPNSIQGDSETQAEWTYQGLDFVYSGWVGVNGELGNEWLIIKGITDRNYKIQVKNWGDNTIATVNYSWGNEEVIPTIEEGSTVSENQTEIENEFESLTALEQD